MKLTGMFLFLAMMVLGVSVADAGPSSNRIKQGSGLLDQLLGDDDAPVSKEPATAEEQRQASMSTEPGYDGVWRHGGKLLLIKRIHRTLYLSGSSDTAAWQAQCVMSGDAAKCLGSGMSKINGEFHYEGDLVRQGTGLRIDWKMNFNNGKMTAGHTVHYRAL